jgi:hypothetical protein
VVAGPVELWATGTVVHQIHRPGDVETVHADEVATLRPNAVLLERTLFQEIYHKILCRKLSLEGDVRHSLDRSWSDPGKIGNELLSCGLSHGIVGGWRRGPAIGRAAGIVSGRFSPGFSDGSMAWAIRRLQRGPYDRRPLQNREAHRWWRVTFAGYPLTEVSQMGNIGLI